MSSVDRIFDARLDFFHVAESARVDSDSQTFSLQGGGLAGAVVDLSDGPFAMPFAVVGRIIWSSADGEREHSIEIEVAAGDGQPVGGVNRVHRQTRAMPSGHRRHKSGYLPELFVGELEPVISTAGVYEVSILIDGQRAGTKLLELHTANGSGSAFGL